MSTQWLAFSFTLFLDRFSLWPSSLWQVRAWSDSITRFSLQEGKVWFVLQVTWIEPLEYLWSSSLHFEMSLVKKKKTRKGRKENKKSIACNLEVRSYWTFLAAFSFLPVSFHNVPMKYLFIYSFLANVVKEMTLSICAALAERQPTTRIFVVDLFLLLGVIVCLVWQTAQYLIDIHVYF